MIEASSRLAPEPQAAGAVSLRVGIDNQHLHIGYSEGCAEIYRGCCLSNAPFLVCDRDKPCHGRPLQYHKLATSQTKRELSNWMFHVKHQLWRRKDWAA